MFVEMGLVLVAVGALGLLGIFLLFRRISVAAKRRSEPFRVWLPAETNQFLQWVIRRKMTSLSRSY